MTAPFSSSFVQRLKSPTQGGKLSLSVGRRIWPQFFCCLSGTTVGVAKDPVAVLVISPRRQFVNYPVTADYSRSWSPSSTLVSWQVEWGDGNISSGSWPDSGSVNHPAGGYALPGTYQVVLTVTDMLGATGEDRQQVEIVAPEFAALAGSMAGSGVWYTETGLQWFCLGLDDKIVYGVALSPFDIIELDDRGYPDRSYWRLWAATSSGLYYSLNGGKSWIKAALPLEDVDVRAVVPSVADENEVYALGVAEGQVWLFRTTDGKSWTGLAPGAFDTPDFEQCLSAWENPYPAFAVMSGHLYSSTGYHRSSPGNAWVNHYFALEAAMVGCGPRLYGGSNVKIAFWMSGMSDVEVIPGNYTIDSGFGKEDLTATTTAVYARGWVDGAEQILKFEGEYYTGHFDSRDGALRSWGDLLMTSQGYYYSDGEWHQLNLPAGGEPTLLGGYGDYLYACAKPEYNPIRLYARRGLTGDWEDTGFASEYAIEMFISAAGEAIFYSALQDEGGGKVKYCIAPDFGLQYLATPPENCNFWAVLDRDLAIGHSSSVGCSGAGAWYLPSSTSGWLSQHPAQLLTMTADGWDVLAAIGAGMDLHIYRIRYDLTAADIIDSDSEIFEEDWVGVVAHPSYPLEVWWNPGHRICHSSDGGDSYELVTPGAELDPIYFIHLAALSPSDIVVGGMAGGAVRLMVSKDGQYWAQAGTLGFTPECFDRSLWATLALVAGNVVQMSPNLADWVDRTDAADVPFATCKIIWEYQ